MSELPPNPRILVIALRRLGDVLLTTPLIRSLKRAYPDAAIDALVFSGTEGILGGNPDIANIIAMPQRASLGQSLALTRRLWRRYHLAVSTQTGDRPTLVAWAAGRRRIGMAEGDGTLARLKRRALGEFVETDPELHRAADILRIADALGIEQAEDIVPPAGPVRPDILPARPYAVIHAVPMFRYKRWTESGWRALGLALGARGLAVIATGGPAEADKRYLDAVWGGQPEVRRLDGVLSWGELAALIGGAAVYVGPDTSVTHLAAATGAPTVALYGPTDPRLFGPWPAGGLADPWVAAGTIQRRGNVWLVQNPLPCLPCQQEGCERHLESYSRCLDELAPQQVLAAVDQALAQRARASSALA
jgi:heptosyltransferase-3